MSFSISIAQARQQVNGIIVVVTAAEVTAGLRTEVAATVADCTAGVDLNSLFKTLQFTGKAGQSCMQVLNSTPVVFVGVGDLDKKADENRETLRRALGSGCNQLRSLEAAHILVCLPEEKPFGVPRATYLEQVATVLTIAQYRFVEFKKDKKVWEPAVFIAHSTTADLAALQIGFMIGSAMNKARSWADMPGNHMYPSILAQKAIDIATEHKLTYKVIEQDEARDMGMGCFYSVAKGSIHQGKIVVLEYAPAGISDAPVIALVGKGVCFDTGGISLKPSNYMTGMKYDMSGAAAVFASMEIIAQLKPNVKAVGIAPLVENMPSGHASKQDDVVVAMNGVSVEIDNTDAEGRLILSDALCYVQKHYNPAVVIDIATLTGSCAATFGPFYAGLMTRDEELSAELSEIGRFVGDKVWPLPLTDEYQPAIESAVADISNSGSPTYKAGAITAGLFLDHFIDKGRRWAHLDIAGVDSKIPGTTYLGKGATGTGVRLMVEFVRRYKKG